LEYQLQTIEEDYQQYRSRAQAAIANSTSDQSSNSAAGNDSPNSPSLSTRPPTESDAFTTKLQQRVKEMKATITKLTQENEQTELLKSNLALKEEEIRSLQLKFDVRSPSIVFT